MTESTDGSRGSRFLDTLFNQSVHNSPNLFSTMFQSPSVLGLDIDEDASEQQREHVIHFLFSEHTLRVCSVFEGDTAEIISGPVNSCNIDYIANDVNPVSRETIDLVGVLLDEIGGLRLIPCYIVGNGCLVGEECVEQLSAISIVPRENESTMRMSELRK